MLLPQGYGIAYGHFIAAYVFACILGIASHAPGGLGVFEATILLALPGVPKEQLRSLLVLRLLLHRALRDRADAAGGTEILLRWRVLQSDMARSANRKDPP